MALAKLRSQRHNMHKTGKIGMLCIHQTPLTEWEFTSYTGITLSEYAIDRRKGIIRRTCTPTPRRSQRFTYSNFVDAVEYRIFRDLSYLCASAEARANIAGECIDAMLSMYEDGSTDCGHIDQQQLGQILNVDLIRGELSAQDVWRLSNRPLGTEVTTLAAEIWNTLLCRFYSIESYDIQEISHYQDHATSLGTS